MFLGSECDPLDCDTSSLANGSQHARKDVVSMFRVKVSRVLLHYHLTPTTKIKNILSIIYQVTIIYVTEFDLTPYIGKSCQSHIKNQSDGREKYVVI
jgi:hypothetical protein